MVYLIHFERKLAHAQHYVGFSSSPAALRRRLDHHRSGNGSRLMNAVVQAGIPYRVVRIWPEGTRTEERRIKNTAHPERICPVCSGQPVKLRAPYWSFTPEAGAAE